MKKIQISKKKRVIIILGTLAAIILIFLAFRFNLGTRIWYLLPSFEDYYVYIPTDLSPEEAAEATVTLTNLSRFSKKPISAEYWEEGKCFHVLLNKRGIYKIEMKTQLDYSRTEYVEIGRDEIYCISLKVGGEVSPNGMAIPEDAFEWNGHSYMVYTYSGGWDGIQEELAELGGYLATLTSEEENEAVYAHLTEHGIYSAYFGLADLDGTGQWQWVTEESLEYTNWHSGEPSSVDERYGQFFLDFNGSTWNDGSEPDRGVKVYYICEWDGCNSSR